MATTIYNETFIKMIAAKLGGSDITTPVGGTANTSWDVRNKIKVYQGTMPDVDVFAADPSAYEASVLATWTDWTPSYDCTVQGVNRVYAKTLPGQGSATTINATGTGTATWAVMFYDTNLDGIPKSVSSVLCDVSEDTGNGVIQLSTTSLVSGQPVTFLSMGYNLSYV